MLSKLTAFFKWFVSRTGVAYLVVIVLALSLVDFNSVTQRVRMRRLNEARPDMSVLVAAAQGDLQPVQQDWRPYEDYFSLVLRYMPDEYVGRMFWGVCRYYAHGLDDRAWEHIRSSADNYPFIFWNLYNAGVFAFKRGEIGLAQVYFQQALLIPADRAVMAMRGSVIYRQLMAAGNFDPRLTERIAHGKKTAQLLLVAASFYLKDYERARQTARTVIAAADLVDKEPLLFYAAASALALGQVQEGMLLLRECIALRSRNPQVYRYMADMLKAAGDDARARQLESTAVSLQQGGTTVFPYPAYLEPRLF